MQEYTHDPIEPSFSLGLTGEFDSAQIRVGIPLIMWDISKAAWLDGFAIQRRMSDLLLHPKPRILKLTPMESTQHEAAQAATNVLASSSVRDLRQIRVDGTGNHIELSGTVRSFYHKQLAQEAIRPVAGGMQVVNRVDVGAIAHS